MTLHSEYEKAAAAMADDVMEYYGFYEGDSYVQNLVIDVPDKELIFFIDLIESGVIKIPAADGESVSELLAAYRERHPNSTYIPVVENYIDETWELVLEPGIKQAVEASILQGGHDNGGALYGGGYEARKDFISAVCCRVADSIREMAGTRI